MTIYKELYQVGDRVIINVSDTNYISDFVTSNKQEVDIIGFCPKEDKLLLGWKTEENKSIWELTDYSYKFLSPSFIKVKNFNEYVYGWWAYEQDVIIDGKVFSYRDEPNGKNCKKCNDFYPYAAANQSDNSFICYGCRYGLSSLF